MVFFFFNRCTNTTTRAFFCIREKYTAAASASAIKKLRFMANGLSHYHIGWIQSANSWRLSYTHIKPKTRLDAR